MARIELQFPDNVIFKSEWKVSITDINYGNHLGNDKVLGYLHEARVQFFDFLGFKESDIAGVSVIQADTAVIYKAEAFYNNLIKVEIAIGEFSRAGFELYYRINNLTLHNITAIAKTGMVCFDYHERKVKPVPEIFKQKCLLLPKI